MTEAELKHIGMMPDRNLIFLNHVKETMDQICKLYVRQHLDCGELIYF